MYCEQEILNRDPGLPSVLNEIVVYVHKADYHNGNFVYS